MTSCFPAFIVMISRKAGSTLSRRLAEKQAESIYYTDTLYRTYQRIGAERRVTSKSNC